MPGHGRTHFTKLTVPVLINQFDKGKPDETNKNALELTSKINSIDTKVTNIDLYLTVHLFVMYSIYMPLILCNI
jgi:hypothetical protein